MGIDTDIFEGSLFEYIEFIHQCGKDKTKVFWGTQKGVPSTQRGARWHIYCTDGNHYSSAGWTQFIMSIWELGANKVELNFTKIQNWIKDKFPLVVDREVTVEYVSDDKAPHYKWFEFDHVKTRAKNMKAAEFREWASNYFQQLGLDFVVEEKTPVREIMEFSEKEAEKVTS